MKKTLAVLMLVLLSVPASAGLNLRTNALGLVAGIVNAGVEYKFENKYSLEANYWKANDGLKLFNYDISKWGVMVRKYIGQGYLGVGYYQLTQKNAFREFFGHAAESKEFIGIEVKVGADRSIFKNNSLKLGYSLGRLFTLSEDYMSPFGGIIKSSEYINIGINLSYEI